MDKLTLYLQPIHNHTWKTVSERPITKNNIDLHDDAALIMEELALGNRIIISNEKCRSPIPIYGKFRAQADICYVWITNDERRRILNILKETHDLERAKKQFEKIAPILQDLDLKKKDG